jgi:hypothetical protein
VRGTAAFFAARHYRVAVRQRFADRAIDGNLPRSPILAALALAATIVGLFFILGVVAAPFLPETKGKPLPHALWLGEAT